MKFIAAGMCRAVTGFIAEHTHEFWEILLTVEGCGTAYCCSSEYSFAAGSLFVYPPGTRHSKISGEMFCDVYIHIEDFLPEFKWQGVIMPCDDNAGTGVKLINLLIGMGEGSARALAAEALRRFILENTGNFPTPYSRDVGAIITALCDNFTNPEYKMDDALNLISYNHDYFRRRFKIETGITPGEFLLNLRMGHAAALLKQRAALGASISDVAAKSGFYDANYFTRVFKKKFGAAPSEF